MVLLWSLTYTLQAQCKECGEDPRCRLRGGGAFGGLPQVECLRSELVAAGGRCAQVRLVCLAHVFPAIFQPTLLLLYCVVVVVVTVGSASSEELLALA